jgi:hypothetical protein
MIIGELAAEKGSDAERQRQGLPSCLNNFDRQ